MGRMGMCVGGHGGKEMGWWGGRFGFGLMGVG